MKKVNDIAAVVQKYIDGNLLASPEILREVFAPGAMMYGYMGEDFVMMTAEEYASSFEGRKSMKESETDYSYEIDEINMRGNIASVSFREYNYMGQMNFATMFQLACCNGVWKVMSKLFMTM